MARAFLIVMDSVGVGGAPDAGKFFNESYPDTGANTVAHIAQSIPGGLKLPTLDALGLGRAVALASGEEAPGLDAQPTGTWGAATEISAGKDTPTGHWELSGVPVPWHWHYFPNSQPAFPTWITDLVCEFAGTEGILGNCHASGTDIIDRLAEEHRQSGWPICYTSGDSVFQIAAHEEWFGLDRLLALCEQLAPKLHELKVGRVIARPFVSASDIGYSRTKNRHDFAMAPPADTLCDKVQQSGGRVLALGKIGDIFSMQGIDEVAKGTDAELMGHLADAISHAPDGSLTFANFVEFDSVYGHRRDVAGYAAHLAWFDQAIGPLLPRLREGDLLLLTADHGNDPTWVGGDHTRERVPVLIHGKGTGSLGLIDFTDVAKIIARHLGVELPEPSKDIP